MYCICLFWDKVFLCRLVGLVHSVDQAALKLMEICPPLLFKYQFFKYISKICNKLLKSCKINKFGEFTFIINARYFHFFCLELSFNLSVSKLFSFFVGFISHIFCLLFLVVHTIQHSALRLHLLTRCDRCYNLKNINKLNEHMIQIAIQTYCFITFSLFHIFLT